MKTIAEKIADLLRIIFGYGIVMCLFAGGATFFGYLAALCIGGEIAQEICTFIYKEYFPVIIKASNILVLLGLVAMYLKGEASLTMNNKKRKENIGRS